jgi:hypothetical protein
MRSTLAEIQRAYLAAFAPPPHIGNAEEAVAALDLIMRNDTRDTVEIARRVKRWIIREHMDHE